MDARTPVALFALGEGRPHQHSQSTVVARMRRFRARARRIEAAGRDVQRPTKSRDRELGLLRRNPGKRHAWCLAKKAAAFFRMSRSIRSSRFSLSRASSEAGLAAPIRPRLPNCQIELAGHGPDRLLLIQHQPDRADGQAIVSTFRTMSSRIKPMPRTTGVAEELAHEVERPGAVQYRRRGARRPGAQRTRGRTLLKEKARGRVFVPEEVELPSDVDRGELANAVFCERSPG